MNKTPILAAGLALTLALPGAGLAQMDGHGSHADQGAPQGGMMQDGMMQDGMMQDGMMA